MDVQEPAGAVDRREQGLAALAEGRWNEAVDELTRAAEGLAPDSEALTAVLAGLGDALWWLGRVDEALTARQRSYEVARAAGDDPMAAITAAWLAREYAAAVGNHAASQGWLARAETLAESVSRADVTGWVALTRAVLATEPTAQVAAATLAVRHAREARDGDLEALALGRLGLGRIAMGALDEGLRYVDEAMATATGGEAGLTTLATLCCDLVLAAELSGALDRFVQWNALVTTVAAERGHPGLLAACATCCAVDFTARGDWAGAEQQLRQVLELLRRTGHRARCVAPTAKLADLLVSQGRLEEASELLTGDDDETLLARGRLAVARGDTAAAVILAERYVRRRGGDSLLTAPALSLLVDAHLAAGDQARADAVALRLAEVAAASGHRRTMGVAALARARVDAAGADHRAALAGLETALDHLTAVAPGALEAAEAHLELARLRAADAPAVAVDEARAALAGFEAAGAALAADRAAALLRDLGDRTRVGDKGVGVLTNREQQVLRLVAQGLTNAEIAGRLFISPKTAGNHVSNILMKLGLRSRVEAAAYAALHAPGRSDAVRG